MIFGALVGFAVGIGATWLAGPLIQRRGGRAEMQEPSGRKTLADALKRRDQTLAGARLVDQVKAQAADAVTHARDSASSTLESATSAPRGVLDSVKERIRDAREAAREGYDEGVIEARAEYLAMREGRDLDKDKHDT
ncbi:MAG: hypothetical protein WEB00_03160 [Dehalococcoidia bacterium]